MVLPQLAAQISAQALVHNKLSMGSSVALMSAGAGAAAVALVVYAHHRGWRIRRGLFMCLAFSALFATGVYLQ